MTKTIIYHYWWSCRGANDSRSISKKVNNAIEFNIEPQSMFPPFVEIDDANIGSNGFMVEIWICYESMLRNMRHGVDSSLCLESRDGFEITSVDLKERIFSWQSSQILRRQISIALHVWKGNGNDNLSNKEITTKIDCNKTILRIATSIYIYTQAI